MANLILEIFGFFRGDFMKSLIICEKEPAGEKFAEFLGATPRDGYWESPNYYIVAARGHLIATTLQGLKSWKLPSFDFRWYIPKSSQEKLELIKQLYADSSEILIATDWDREGEVIGERIVAYLNRKLNGKYYLPNRVYFSALTKSEVLRAVNNIKQMDETLLAQGHARNYADTVIGLNLTKLLTKIYKIDLKHEELSQALSMGRVQSPVLSYITERTTIEVRLNSSVSSHEDEEIRTYIHTPEADVEADFPAGVDEVELKGYKYEEEEKHQAWQLPNTDDAFREIDLDPHVTMEIMESLYLRGFMTYPRTKSTQAPPEVLEKLENVMRQYNLLQSSNFSHDNTPSGVSEAGKFPLLPTPEGIEAYVKGLLSKRDLVVFTWLIARVNKAFAPPLKVKKKYAVFEYELQGETYTKRIVWGEEVENPEDAIDYLWLDTYPEVQPGKYPLIRIRIKKKTVSVDGGSRNRFYRLKDKDIVSWMTWEKIGTEATRQTYAPLLRERKYIDEANLPTQVGEVVSRLIARIGLDTTLTAEMESRIEQITSLSDLPSFMQWVNDVTTELIDRVSSIDLSEIDVFICPKGHKAELANRFWNGNQVLLLKCRTCDKLYPI
jgi:DNA topoisomerase IA